VALDTTSQLELPTFVLITLSDGFLLTYGPQDRQRWSDADILPCLEGTGIAAFQYAIRRYSLTWAEEWEALLDLIDKALTADVSSPSEIALRRCYS
jgi:hypothetical protein